MDFLDPKKKRAHTIRLFVGYFLVAVAIAFGTLVLLFASFGYGVDRHGRVIQNGLLFVSSTPSNATLQVDGIGNATSKRDNTDTRMTLEAGQYRLTITKDGYRTWQKNIALEGSSVERVDYPFLFPSQLVTKNLKEYSQKPSLINTSPDRHWLIVGRPGALGVFDEFDTTDSSKAPQTVSLPNRLLTSGKAQSIKLLEWSNDNNHFLLEHTFSGKKEFIIVDRNSPEKSVNLNDTFKQSPTQVVLRDKKYNRYYLYIQKGGVLEEAALGEKQIQPIATNVVAFKPHGNDMLEYVSDKTTSKTNKVTVYIRTNDTDYALRTLPSHSKYVLNLTQYSDHWYVAVGAAVEDKVYVYKDPLDQLQKHAPGNLMARTLRVTNPTSLTFSNNAQFLAAQGGQKFAVFDAEQDRLYYFDVKEKLTTQPAQWMDGDRLTSVSDDKVIVFEFDGLNITSLNNAVSGTAAQFDREYANLFALAPNGKTYAVTQTALRVK